MPYDLTATEDLTLHGSVFNLLDALAASAAVAADDDPTVRQAAERLRAALAGPDWQEMAARLDLGDNALTPAAENLLDRWPTASDSEADELLETLRGALEEDQTRTLERIVRVAHALEAAAHHGSATKPLDGLAALKVEPGTVLCFPMGDNVTAHQHAQMQAALKRLRATILEQTGVAVPMMVIPASSVPTVMRLEEGAPPPKGVRVRVKVGGRSVLVEQTAKGWHVQSMLETGVSLAEATQARELAEAGHGVPVSP